MKLFECLKTIPNPRKKRGVRHSFQSVLQFVLLGFTCRLVAIEHMVAFFTPIWGQIKELNEAIITLGKEYIVQVFWSQYSDY